MIRFGLVLFTIGCVFAAPQYEAQNAQVNPPYLREYLAAQHLLQRPAQASYAVPRPAHHHAGPQPARLPYTLSQAQYQPEYQQYQQQAQPQYQAQPQAQYRAPQPAPQPQPQVQYRPQPQVQYRPQPQQQVQYRPQPQAERSHAQEQRDPQEDYDPHPSYQFGFDVNDDQFTNYQNRKEERDGDVIKGSYSVVDSDGFIRTVKYTADPKEGFKAEVSREPTDIVVKIPTPKPQLQQQAHHSQPQPQQVAPQQYYRYQQQE